MKVQCPYDPTLVYSKEAMYQCPVCGDMVTNGMPHIRNDKDEMPVKEYIRHFLDMEEIRANSSDE